MADKDTSDLYAEALLLAHMRRIVIDVILDTLPRDQAEPAASAAVQRLVQYLDEGPVPSIARNTTPEQFRAAIDQTIEELQSRS